MQKRAPTRRVSYNPVITLLEMDGNGICGIPQKGDFHGKNEFSKPTGVGRLGVFHSFPKTMDQMNGVLKISNPIPSKV